MSLVRAAKKFELGFVVFFWNINFQAIFGHIIEHKVNYLFTRTPLMCGSHCNVCPASLGGRGDRVPALTILRWPPAVARARGLGMEAAPCTSTSMARGNPQKWGIPSPRGSFRPLFVTRGGSPVRNASHKPEI